MEVLALVGSGCEEAMLLTVPVVLWTEVVEVTTVFPTVTDV